MKDTNRKGTITETKVILKLLELGFNVFTPYGDGSKIDLIIQNNQNQLSKVQVKTSRIEGGAETFNAYATARVGKKVPYSKNDIDFYATIDSDKNVYLIPIEVIKHLNPTVTKYKEFII